MPVPADLIERVLRGDRLACARAITLVENEAEGAEQLLGALHARAGRAARTGITGPPGAGKSTLVQALGGALRAKGRTVGIVAVDPTSPFSGGALLGDRVRMGRLATDPGVFIRSMASRGFAGGLARHAEDACDVLDAAGKDAILVETVGVGQGEIDIAAAADTTVVVLSPEGGDVVQGMKAGLLEVADVICVNKADREGAGQFVSDLEAALDVADAASKRARPKIARTVATKGEGVAELLALIDEHRAGLAGRGDLARRREERARRRVRALVEARLTATFWSEGDRKERLAALARAVAEGRQDPYAAARSLLDAPAPPDRPGAP